MLFGPVLIVQPLFKVCSFCTACNFMCCRLAEYKYLSRVKGGFVLLYQMIDVGSAATQADD